MRIRELELGTLGTRSVRKHVSKERALVLEQLVACEDDESDSSTGNGLDEFLLIGKCSKRRCSHETQENYVIGLSLMLFDRRDELGIAE